MKKILLISGLLLLSNVLPSSSYGRQTPFRTVLAIETPFALENIDDAQSFAPVLTQAVTNVLVSMQKDLDFVLLREGQKGIKPELIFGLSYSYIDGDHPKSKITFLLKDAISQKTINEVSHTFFHLHTKGKDQLARDGQELLMQLQPLMVRLMPDLLPSAQWPKQLERAAAEASPVVEITFDEVFLIVGEVHEEALKIMVELTYQTLDGYFAQAHGQALSIKRKGKKLGAVAEKPQGSISTDEQKEFRLLADDDIARRKPPITDRKNRQVLIGIVSYEQGDEVYFLHMHFASWDPPFYTKKVALLAEPLREGSKRVAAIQLFKAVQSMDGYFSNLSDKSRRPDKK